MCRHVHSSATLVSYSHKKFTKPSWIKAFYGSNGTNTNTGKTQLYKSDETKKFVRLMSLITPIRPLRGCGIEDRSLLRFHHWELSLCSWHSHNNSCSSIIFSSYWRTRFWKIIFVKDITCCYGNAVFDAKFSQNLTFSIYFYLYFWKHFEIFQTSVILRVDVNYRIFPEHKFCNMSSFEALLLILCS